MIRFTDIFLILAVIVGAVWTFQIKHESELSAKKLVSLRGQIAVQENKIVLLKADRAIMTSPERLEALAKTFKDQLKLEDMQSTQIIDLSELPPEREIVKPDVMQADADGIDRLIKTGSVQVILKATPTPRPKFKRPKR